jgi:hypothetical protein
MNSRRSSRSSVRSSNAESSHAEDTDHFDDLNSRRGSRCSLEDIDRGEHFDAEAKPNGPSQFQGGKIGDILSLSLPLPNRRVTAPAKLQKQLQSKMAKFQAIDSLSDESTASELHEEGERLFNDVSPERQDSPGSNRAGAAAAALTNFYQQYKANEQYTHSQEQAPQKQSKPTHKKQPMTFAAAWAAGNGNSPNSWTTAQKESQQPVPAPGGYPNNTQVDVGGYPNNTQAPCFLPSSYVYVTGQMGAPLPMPFGPNAGMDSVSAEQLLQAQPEYYDD